MNTTNQTTTPTNPTPTPERPYYVHCDLGVLFFVWKMGDHFSHLSFIDESEAVRERDRLNDAHAAALESKRLADEAPRLAAENKLMRDALEAEVARLRGALQHAAKDRKELIGAICTALSEVLKIIDEHFDEDPPEGSMGSPPHAALRGLSAHLLGALIDENGEELVSSNYFDALATQPQPGAKPEARE